MSVRVRPSVLFLVAGTVVLAALAIVRGWSGPPLPAFWFWLAACLLGELLWVRLPVGRVTVSMASCAHFATLLMLPRDQAMLVCLVSGPAVEAIIVRKPLIRALFNGGQAALSVGAASWVLSALSGVRPPGDPLGDFGVPALASAAVLYFVFNSGLVSLAVALHERIPFAPTWRTNFGTGYELLSNGALFSLGALLAATAATHGLAGALLVVLPLLVAFVGYRWHAHSRVTLDRAPERKAA